MSDTTKAKVAVFFDYENIVYSLRNRFEQKANFEALMTKCNEFGTIVEARAFADWGLPYMSPALMYALQSSGFDLVFVPTGSTQANSPRKNVADLYMAIQVMDVLHARPDISTFVLMTGDRDFMPLVNHLKRNGKHVVAIGVDGSSSYYLTQSVDDFFYYSEVEQIYEERPKRLKGRLTNAYDALVQAVRVIHEKGKAPRMTNLKPVMIDLMSGFDEKELQDAHGRYFQRFKDFVQEAQRRGLVRIVRRGNSHEVYLADQEVQDSIDTPEGEPIGLQVAYKLLVQAVQEASDQGKSPRAVAIRTRLRRLYKGFNEQLVYNGGGKPFDTFADFVISAEKAGLVELSGNEKSLEIRPLVETEPEKRKVTGIDAREAIIAGLRAYANYPTSFLSLASFVHRHNEQHGLIIEEQLARALMTESVDCNLLEQIVLPNGRRKYALKDNPELIKAFIQGNAAKPAADEAESEPATEAEPVSEPAAPSEEVAAPTPAPAEPAAVKGPITDPYAALTNALNMLAAEEKDAILPRIKNSIKKQMPSFSEGDFTDSAGNPFQKFKDFILEAQNRGIVRVVEREGKQPQVVLNRSTKPLLEADTLAEAQAAIKEAGTPEPKPENKNDAISVDELTAAIAEAAAVDESPPKKADAPKSAPEPERPAHLDYATITDKEQRELIINGLRTYRDYPGPFMAILTHCRSIRDQREVRLDNRDLRELLSESNKLNLLVRTTERGTHPTLYAYVEDEALIRQFVMQEQSEPIAEAVESADDSAQAETAQPAVTETAAETAAVVETPSAPEPAAETVAETPAEQPEVDDNELRQFVVDTLRSFTEGMQFKAIESALKQARDEANIAGSNQRLKSLLQFASRQGVLGVISPYGMRPRLFGFTSDESTVNAYLGIVPEPEPTVESEPVAEVVEAAAPESEAVEPAAAQDEAADASETPADAAQEAVVAEEPVAQVEETPEPEAAAEEADNPLMPVFDSLVDAVHQLNSEGKSTGFGSVKRRLKKLIKNFDEKEYQNAQGKSFKRFKDFVLSAREQGIVELDETEKNILVAAASEPETVVESPSSADDEAVAAEAAVVVTADAPAEEAEAPAEEAEVVVTADAPAEEAETPAEEPAAIVEAEPSTEEPAVAETDATDTADVQPEADTATDEAEPTAEADAAAEAENTADVETPAEVEDVEPVAVEPQAAEPVAESQGADAADTEIDAAVVEIVEAADPLTNAYSTLKQAVTEAAAAKRSQRLSAIRPRILKLDPEFDLTKLRKAEGGKFKSLPDFVRSAQTAGYVQLEGKGAQLTVHLADEHIAA